MHQFFQRVCAWSALALAGAALLASCGGIGGRGGNSENANPADTIVVRPPHLKVPRLITLPKIGVVRPGPRPIVVPNPILLLPDALNAPDFEMPKYWPGGCPSLPVIRLPRLPVVPRTTVGEACGLRYAGNLGEPLPFKSSLHLSNEIFVKNDTQPIVDTLKVAPFLVAKPNIRMRPMTGRIIFWQAIDESPLPRGWASLTVKSQRGKDLKGRFFVAQDNYALPILNETDEPPGSLLDLAPALKQAQIVGKSAPTWVIFEDPAATTQNTRYHAIVQLKPFEDQFSLPFDATGMRWLDNFGVGQSELPGTKERIVLARQPVPQYDHAAGTFSVQSMLPLPAPRAGVLTWRINGRVVPGIGTGPMAGRHHFFDSMNVTVPADVARLPFEIVAYKLNENGPFATINVLRTTITGGSSDFNLSAIETAAPRNWQTEPEGCYPVYITLRIDGRAVGTIPLDQGGCSYVIAKGVVFPY